MESEPQNRKVFCSRPWTGFEVEHDGTVQPCCMAKAPCGNVLRESLHEIWNGAAYREFRRKMAAGEWRDTCKPECPRLHGDFDDCTPQPISAAFAENYRRSLEEIERRELVLESLPRFWKTTHSTRCNIDCVMCYQERDDLRQLPETFYAQMTAFYPAIQEIELIGGETFSIKRLRRLMESFSAADHPDVRFAFVTNGSIHDEKTLAMVGALRVSWLNVSLDAATAPTYAVIRRGGDFDTTMRGLRAWTALGRERQFVVTTSFTVMRDNVPEMRAFVELAQSLEIDCLFGTIGGTKGNQHQIAPDDLARSIGEVKSALDASPRAMPLARLTLASLEGNFLELLRRHASAA